MGILRSILARAIRFGEDGLQGPEREEEIRLLKSRLGISKWSASVAWKSLAEANAKLDETRADLSASRKLLAEAVGASEPMTIFNLIDIVKERFRPEGLRSACEAIGLVCLDKGVYDLIVATGEKHRVTAESAEKRWGAEVAHANEWSRRAHAAESEAAALRADRKAAVDRAEEADRLVAEYRDRLAELEAPLPEATVDELERAYRAGSGGFSGPATVFMNGGIRAVAERVRRERCLIARAVAANIDVRVAEDQGGGFLVAAHRAGEDEDVERNVPAAEVPASLARMLSEVGA